jgi:hypothetical protein
VVEHIIHHTSYIIHHPLLISRDARLPFFRQKYGAAVGAAFVEEMVFGTGGFLTQLRQILALPPLASVAPHTLTTPFKPPP